MMAAAVERGGVRAAFMNPGVGAPAPAPAVAAAPGGSAMAGAGARVRRVWVHHTCANEFIRNVGKIDRSSPSCVPRYIKPNAIVHVCK